VSRAKAVAALEAERLAGAVPAKLAGVFEALVAAGAPGADDPAAVEVGSTIYAVKPGDGSAREQAASCQRVLGGLANITSEYATKRYRSNVMNWGMVPFQMKGEPSFEVGDYVYVPGIRSALDGSCDAIPAWVVRAAGAVERIELFIAEMTPEERAIVKAGCLINFNRERAR
jgi:aconitate hydratase